MTKEVGKKQVIKKAKKEVKAKSTKTKKPTLNNKEKTRKEIEEMFSFGFGCDCSSCHLSCGDRE